MTPKQRAMQSAADFKERLKAARKVRGVTQSELAAKAELSAVTLSKLETGVNRPTFEVIVAISHALEITPNFLLGWTEEISHTISPSQKLSLQRLILVAENLDNGWLQQLISLAERASRNAR
jgi:transcriptional regulator with XRE-family HTH domain